MLQGLLDNSIMGSKLEKVIGKELVPKGSFPSWLKKSTQYEVLTGSVAYGCSTDTSDMDIYGFCVPPKNIVFPHTNGVLYGFDNPKEFWQWQKHHIIDEASGMNYDFTIYNIVKYFKLCMDCNPNMVDSLFVPGDCVLHCTPIAGMVRARKEIFLSKKAFHAFTGYLHSQIAKLDRKPVGLKEVQDFEEKHGLDHKSVYDDIINECKERGLQI
jgi:predicted nucleotidyltransferase